MSNIAELETVAKKNARRTKTGQVRRPVAVVIKGNEEWREWVEELAKHCRMSVSALVDFALVQIAKQQEFNKKPPER